MKFKESNKQKFIMRNVYINQIMKPQIQNNLNYAYFENPRDIVDYCNNQGLGLNNKSIFLAISLLRPFIKIIFLSQINQKKIVPHIEKVLWRLMIIFMGKIQKNSISPILWVETTKKLKFILTKEASLKIN